MYIYIYIYIYILYIYIYILNMLYAIHIYHLKTPSEATPCALRADSTNHFCTYMYTYNHIQFMYIYNILYIIHTSPEDSFKSHPECSSRRLNRSVFSSRSVAIVRICRRIYRLHTNVYNLYISTYV